MKFNHIINDIIDWIRRILWYKEKKIKQKPYQILDVIEGTYGYIKRVERDTPRAVLTYIYTPYPVFKEGMTVPSESLWDYHICLDHLWALDNPELTAKPFRASDRKESPRLKKIKKTRHKYGDCSHSILVLKASRFLSADGSYVTSQIFQKNYDFIGRGNPAYRDRYAIAVVKDFVSFLTNKKIQDFDWESEIYFSQKSMMGKDYLVMQD